MRRLTSAGFTPPPAAAVRAAQGITVEKGPAGRLLPRVLYLGAFDGNGTWTQLGPFSYTVAGQAIDEALRKSEPIWLWDPAVGEWRRPN